LRDMKGADMPTEYAGVLAIPLIIGPVEAAREARDGHGVGNTARRGGSGWPSRRDTWRLSSCRRQRCG